MRVRYGVAAVFAASIALVLILRNEGYLHGRVEGGPLRLLGTGTGLAVKPGQTAAFGLDVIVDGGPVDVQSVRGEFVSDGLQLLGPRRSDRPCGVCRVRGWPPRGSAPLHEDEVPDGRSRALLGARPARPGIYYVDNLVALYKKGLKSFRRTYGRDYCVVASRRPRKTPCRMQYSPPANTLVAEAGGASRYGTPIRFTKDGPQATFPAVTGERTIGITLTNLSQNSRIVTGLSQLVVVEDTEIAIRQVAPEEVFIRPHDGRRVRFEITVAGCLAADAPSVAVEELEGQVGAGEDVVPLSVALNFAGAASCA